MIGPARAGLPSTPDEYREHTIAPQKNCPADSREMYAIHTMFRREFAALPALIRGVAPHDRTRARTVADHARLVVDLLHTHHRSEDEHCWPKVVERGADRAAAVAELMESQHRVLDGALQTVERQTDAWRESADASARDALAHSLDELLAPLDAHLRAEEETMLPLIDRHLTAAEWADVGNQGLATLAPSKVPVLFGMLLQDATVEQRALFKDAIPTPVFAVMSRLGPLAHRRYRRRVFAAG